MTSSSSATPTRDTPTKSDAWVPPMRRSVEVPSVSTKVPLCRYGYLTGPRLSAIGLSLSEFHRCQFFPRSDILLSRRFFTLMFRAGFHAALAPPSFLTLSSIRPTAGKHPAGKHLAEPLSSCSPELQLRFRRPRFSLAPHTDGPYLFLGPCRYLRPATGG